MEYPIQEQLNHSTDPVLRRTFSCEPKCANGGSEVPTRLYFPDCLWYGIGRHTWHSLYAGCQIVIAANGAIHGTYLLKTQISSNVTINVG